SNVPTLPFYPYISIIGSDRKIIYRPGTLSAVTEVLALDGATIAAGDPLFRLLGPGRSSWTTFYNPSAPYQVVVSLQTLPGGRDLAHGRMRIQDLVDLARVDLEPGDDDHLLLSVDDVEVAVLVHPHDVTRVEPAVAQHGRGLIGPLPIPIHEVRAAEA